MGEYKILKNFYKYLLFNRQIFIIYPFIKMEEHNENNSNITSQNRQYYTD